jgi:hypothetical protein
MFYILMVKNKKQKEDNKIKCNTSKQIACIWLFSYLFECEYIFKAQPIQ